MAINWDLYSKKLCINGDNIRKRQVNLMRDAYANDFSHSPSYRESYINNSGASTGIQVLDTKFGNVKTIYMLPDDILAVGDIIEFDGNKWLCVNAVDNGVNISGTVNRCTHTLTINKNSILYEVPCCIENNIRLYQMSQSDNKYFTELSDNIILRLPHNNITSEIEINDVYQIGKYRYKILNISDVIETGLLIVKMQITTEAINPISEDPEPTQHIEIQGQDSIIFGNSAIYTADYPQEVVFSVEGDNASIIEQEGNQCTVKAGNTYGTVTLVATFEDVEGRKDILIKNYF